MAALSGSLATVARPAIPVMRALRVHPVTIATAALDMSPAGSASYVRSGPVLSRVVAIWWPCWKAWAETGCHSQWIKGRDDAWSIRPD